MSDEAQHQALEPIVAMAEILTPSLIRAARALLHMDQVGLAESSGISRKTISLIEADDSPPAHPKRLEILRNLQKHFEEEYGVEFTFASLRSGEGVKLKRAYTPKPKPKS
ncbi:helix-turn-helix domain-containing protein [Bradyrhizobium sp. I71]|jgi:DNA-binding XRE family transcriptional regulator|uniref:helix-turn-helix transcriptional regulator n=1 Tax=Bradyrhizobium sp. I71 TaxID=2590772 RepID=UPI001EF80089|nr:helix-turn-helix domain-containing protein [Bradyrhizobium sp. I71]ULL01577.1 helix-turn-helix domain-containing protein [Bradyrhizobium sp. I71]